MIEIPDPVLWFLATYGWVVLLIDVSGWVSRKRKEWKEKKLARERAKIPLSEHDKMLIKVWTPIIEEELKETSLLRLLESKELGKRVKVPRYSEEKK